MNNFPEKGQTNSTKRYKKPTLKIFLKRRKNFANYFLKCLNGNNGRPCSLYIHTSSCG